MATTSHIHTGGAARRVLRSTGTKIAVLAASAVAATIGLDYLGVIAEMPQVALATLHQRQSDAVSSPAGG